MSKLIDIAMGQIGYLEKLFGTPVNLLYSKTANAGTANWTKYWYEMNKKFGLANYQGSYWCMCFIAWIMTMAYGLQEMQRLMYCKFPINCQDEYALFKAHGRVFKSPKPMDLVVFWNGKRMHHVQLVAKVDGTYFYTIGGNTGAQSAIPNGGGVYGLKRYNTASAVAAGDRFLRPDYKENSANTTIAEIATTVVNVLAKGSVGDAVKNMQNMLVACGFSCGSYGADGDFGAATKAAVEAFQKASGLAVDGEYGIKTKYALEQAFSAKNEKPTGIAKFNYSSIFDAEYYLKANPDVAKVYNTENAIDHYTLYGAKEGRLPSAIFNPRYYRDKYRDLKAAFGDDFEGLAQHFVEFGMKEFRRGSVEFNPVAYKEKYSDLQAAFKNDYKEYYKHYLTYGIKEGRKA